MQAIDMAEGSRYQDIIEEHNDSQIAMLSSHLPSLITGKHTSLQSSQSVTSHGLTRSCEITDILKKFGNGISNIDVRA